MPFDPTLPANNAPNSSAQMRAQFNGLKDLIDAIQSVGSATVDGVNTLPPGEPAEVTLSVNGGTLHFTFGIPAGADGSPGDAGPPFAAAVVDGVNTLPAGEPATVESTFDGSTVHFTFGIPRGNDGSNGTDGAQGPPGNDGSQGSPGNDGAQGPPFAHAVVDAVNTLPPGEQATVESSFDGNTVHLTFGIPAGLNGSDGEQGIQGEPGMHGMPGTPGEVSFQQLADAIATTSANSNGVDTLGLAVSDPPTQSEMQQIADKLDELINALRR
jgi:hypothetical protein